MDVAFSRIGNGRETMKDQIERMQQLQSVDKGLRASREEIAGLREKLRRLDKQFEDLRASVSGKAEDSKSAGVTLKVKETELAAAEEHIAKLQVQLNSARSNKEFTALKHEIATEKEKASRIEDEILGLMDQVEGGDESIKKLKDELSRREHEVESQKADLQQRIADIQQHQQTLEKERREIGAGVEPQYLAIYERVHKGHPDGIAIVAAKNFVCTGCNMTLPPNVVNYLMGNTKLIRCPSCQRILYLEPD